LAILNCDVGFAVGGEEVKSLEFLIGSWNGTATVGGEESKARVEYAWMNQNNFVMQTISLGDMKIVHIVGWDPATSSMRTWGFGGQGGHGEMAWTKLGDHRWKEDSPNWIAANGEKAHFLLETKVTGDELLIQGFFKTDEETKVVIKAQRAKASAPTAAQAWLTYLVGTWEFELGDGRKGEVSYQTAGKTPALVFHGAAGDFSILGVFGWRADLKMLVETDFNTQQTGVNGNLNREYAVITSKSIKGSGKFWDSSGVSGSQSLEYERISDDDMILTGSESDSGGTPWVVKFKRVK
jgi:hypothetical protein